MFAVKAKEPTATLRVPVVSESKAVLPTFTFASVNPIPNLPAVIATPTLMFCRNVAFVFVLIFSVLATPVKFAPLPTNCVAVTIPANSALPSTLILAATPTPEPTSIPCLAVTKPTESIFVTSSYVRVQQYQHHH